MTGQPDFSKTAKVTGVSGSVVSFTIAAGDTSVTVNHGLPTAPSAAIPALTSDTYGRRVWVSAITSTQVTITIDSICSSDITGEVISIL
jgi:hypothetical protein